jgi:hypothetical protein
MVGGDRIIEMSHCDEGGLEFILCRKYVVADKTIVVG